MTFWRRPLHIRLLSIGLLVSSFFVLQLTAIQPQVALIPAMEGDVKVRPADLPNPVPPVVSLIEADKRAFKEKPLPPPSPWDVPLPYRHDGLILETNNQSGGSVARPKPVWFEEVDDTFLFCSGPCVGLDGGWPKFEVLTPKCSSDSQWYEVGTDPDTPAALVLLEMECMLRSPLV